ncbi:winged helix-turn-helix transcriptional regulator [candidate division WWE3 bacterium]|nr:winged helix-turn-helix transcriptional regulator [candidate division WWE3 bacterium]
MLKDLFISEVRVNILKAMLPYPEKSFHVRAIVREVDTEINAVRRELARLTNLGLLRKRPSGNRIYYSVETISPYYPELLSLIAKESGLGFEIIKSAKKLGEIKYAVLSRGFSRGRVFGVFDVDLFLVGNSDLRVLDALVKKYQDKLGREINYSVMSQDDFEFRKRKNDQFVMKILSQSRTMLIGDEEEFSVIM